MRLSYANTNFIELCELHEFFSYYNLIKFVLA
jgi:hypothetical protein